MNKLLLPMAIGAMVAVSSQALIIDVDGAKNSTFGQGTASEGTLAITTLIADDVASGAAQAFTISGLTLDGFDVADDSIVVNLTLTTDGQAIQTTTSTGAGWLSSGGVRLDNAGEYVQWNFGSVDVLLGGTSDAAATAATTFLGFDGVKMGGWDQLTEIALINGTEFTYDSDDEWFSTPLSQTLRTEAVTGSSFRPSAMSFQIDTIPEPATLGMVAVFGGGILFIRRNFAM